MCLAADVLREPLKYLTAENLRECVTLYDVLALTYADAKHHEALLEELVNCRPEWFDLLNSALGGRADLAFLAPSVPAGARLDDTMRVEILALAADHGHLALIALIDRLQNALDDVPAARPARLNDRFGDLVRLYPRPAGRLACDAFGLSAAPGAPAPSLAAQLLSEYVAVLPRAGAPDIRFADASYADFSGVEGMRMLIASFRSDDDAPEVDVADRRGRVVFSARPTDSAAARERLRWCVEQAIECRAHVLLLPELSMTAAMTEMLSALLEASFVRLGHEMSLRLVVAGSQSETRSDGLPLNVSCVLARDGRRLWRQEKRHSFRFDAAGRLHIEGLGHGDAGYVVCDIWCGRVSVLICVDFLAEEARELDALSTGLYLVPAMTPRTLAFHREAQSRGRGCGSVTAVCNALNFPGEMKAPCASFVYLPVRSAQEGVFSAEEAPLMLLDFLAGTVEPLWM